MYFKYHLIMQYKSLICTTNYIQQGLYVVQCRYSVYVQTMRRRNKENKLNYQQFLIPVHNSVIQQSYALPEPN